MQEIWQWFCVFLGSLNSLPTHDDKMSIPTIGSNIAIESSINQKSKAEDNLYSFNSKEKEREYNLSKKNLTKRMRGRR
jgi:hypothetical protein